MESFISDTCSAHLFPCLLSHLSCGFLLDLTNTILQVSYCRDWAYKHQVSDRNLGLMYILWDLGKRFRARFQDSAAHFLSAGSRCSTEFLTAWMHSCTARDKMLGCGSQQTCLRKPLMSTSQNSAGFEAKAVHQEGRERNLFSREAINSSLSLLGHAQAHDGVTQGLFRLGSLPATSMDLDYTCTLATLTSPSPPALREQWVKWSREKLAVHKGLERKGWSGLFRFTHSLFHWLVSLDSFIVSVTACFIAQGISLHKTFHCVQCISLLEKTLSILIHCCFLNIPKGQWFKAMGLHHSQLISLPIGIVKGSFPHRLAQEHCLCISVDK